MSDTNDNDAALLFREISALRRSLKTAASSRQNGRVLNSDRADLLQRLRRQSVTALFAHPGHRETDSIDGTLWAETSYAIIKDFRNILAAQRNDDSVKPTAIRKAQAEFKTFLTSEESFWGGLALKIVRAYRLSDAKTALLALNISSPDPQDPSASISHSKDTSFNPGEEIKQQDVPSTSKYRHKKIALVQRILIRLGDLARYREDERYSAAESKANYRPTDGKGSKRGIQKKGNALRPRDYSRAIECYNQARALAPENGHPANQLAVLAVTNRERFNAVYYCYMALCVRHPFPTANDNLRQPLRQAFEHAHEARDQPRDSLEKFKDTVVLLHAIWHLKPKSPGVVKRSGDVANAFTKAVTSRSLPSDVITRTLLLSLGALWHMRMFVPSIPASPDRKQDTTDNAREDIMESVAFFHVLSLCRGLMGVAINEMEEGRSLEPEVAEADGDEVFRSHTVLAQRITAVFRRTLPALRLASKWVKANMDALITRSAGEASSTTEMASLWSLYASFLNGVVKTFPLAQLPKLSVVLEEDLEVRGFAPLKDFGESSARGGVSRSSSSAQDQRTLAHPNEEQLMRIHELLLDGLHIAQQPDSPLMYIDGRFRVTGDIPQSSSLLPSGLGGGTRAVDSDAESVQPVVGDEAPSEQEIRNSNGFDDDETTSSQTEDDPVNLAMRVSLNGVLSDDEEDEDEVLYPIYRSTHLAAGSRELPNSVSTSSAPAGLSVPMNVPLMNSALSSTSTNTSGYVADASSSITAEDLLAQVIGGFSASSQRQAISGQRRMFADSEPRSAPPQQLLFGASSNSVWNSSNHYQPNHRLERYSEGGTPSSGPRGFSLAQSQMSADHQHWTRPHDMFGGGPLRSTSSSGMPETAFLGYADSLDHGLPSLQKPSAQPPQQSQAFGQSLGTHNSGLPLGSSLAATYLGEDALNQYPELSNTTSRFAGSSVPGGVSQDQDYRFRDHSTQQYIGPVAVPASLWK